MKIEPRPLDQITPYARNPRRNQSAIATVKASLKEYGWQQPIVVDPEGVIIAGHTRYLAALELGWTEAPVHVARDLTPAQVKAYRLMDNKSHERAEWDMDLLALELEDLKGLEFDLELTGFGEEDLAGIASGQDQSAAGTDETYSRKIEAPIYEPTGPCPAIAELYEEDKYRELVKEIDAAELPKEIAEFLRIAATRHTVFKFRQIAEFYAHASADIQRLMEKSGLVIIDFNKAIEYGFVHLTERLGQIADIEGWNDEG